MTKSTEMSVSSTLQTAWDNKRKGEDLFNSLAAIRELTKTMLKSISQFKAIIQAGSVSNLSPELMDTMKRWEAIFDIARASITEDPDIMTLYNWVPGLGIEEDI